MKLELIKMGCNINDEDLEKTDLSNYRFWVKDLKLKNAIKVIKSVYNNDTQKYEDKEFSIDKIDILEIHSGARYNDKKERIDMFGCWFDTEYTIENVGSFRLLDLENSLNAKNWNSMEINYNKKFILDMVNSITKNEYTDIIEIDYKG